MDPTTYHSHRASLIAQDRALRTDYNRPSLTPDEIKADEIIRKLRAKEAETIWGAEHPDIVHPFPGMEFLTAKPLVMKTKIFELLSKMPKGALLHAHLDATVDTAWLLNEAYKYPAYHVRAFAPSSDVNLSEHLPLTKKSSLDVLLPEFCVFPPNISIEMYDSLTDPKYQPESWVPLSKARDNFSPNLGGPTGFDKWVQAGLMISPQEAYNTYNTVPKIWTKFQSTFRVCNGLIRYEPLFKNYVKEFLRSSLEDGISYIEARMNFLFRTMPRENGEDTLSSRESLLIVDQVVKEFREELAQSGREGDFIGFKLIYSTLRFITNEELDWYLEDCLNLKKEFPHLLAGFDLVGYENVGKPLIYYLDRLLAFKEKQKAEGVDIPFIFHAGETDGDGTLADDNLYDAILLGTKRIGHGFSLIKHPELMKICRERGIALEVCPISNEILRLTSSMPMHPLPALLNHGIPVALCSDDPAIFGSMGLTFDYFQVLVSSEVSGLITVAEVARDSIKYSTLDESEKDQALKKYNEKWNEFIAFIIAKESEALA